jgi:DNA-binding response OmpR family regulator
MSDRKRRILIVDDEPDILWSLSLLLERDYDVTSAEDGKTALQALADGPYHAVILDLMMPGMDGAALKREMDARGFDVPVVIVSAFSDVAERAADLRVRDYMTKPIDIPKLETMLARVTEAAARRGGGSGDGGDSQRDHVRRDGAPIGVPGDKGGDGRKTNAVDGPAQATRSFADGRSRLMMRYALTMRYALPRATEPSAPTTVWPAAAWDQAPVPRASTPRHARR